MKSKYQRDVKNDKLVEEAREEAVVLLKSVGYDPSKEYSEEQKEEFFAELIDSGLINEVSDGKVSGTASVGDLEQYPTHRLDQAIEYIAGGYPGYGYGTNVYATMNEFCSIMIYRIYEHAIMEAILDTMNQGGSHE